jgi:hypothetical protein
MCIKTKIAELQQQIEKLEKLKSLLQKTQPLLTSISVICADYRQLAPEELPFLMEEILEAAQVDYLWVQFLRSHLQEMSKHRLLLLTR